MMYCFLFWWNYWSNGSSLDLLILEEDVFDLENGNNSHNIYTLSFPNKNNILDFFGTLKI